MHAALPAALDSAALSRRLGELAGDERALQVAFGREHMERCRRRSRRGQSTSAGGSSRSAAEPLLVDTALDVLGAAGCAVIRGLCGFP